MRRIHRPSPAMIIATLALFVALGGTAVAAGIVPRAKLADNALKLQNKTAEQVAAMARPQVTSVAGLVTVKTATWNIAAGQDGTYTVACDAGQKAISGGWADPSTWATGYDSHPSPDGTGWLTLLHVSSNSPSAQSGTVYAVCLK